MKKTKAKDNAGTLSLRIEHVALWTEDIERLTAFYSTYFGAAGARLYTNPQKGFVSRFLDFGDGTRIELMSTTEIVLERSDPGAQRMGLTHFALAAGSEKQVYPNSQSWERGPVLLELARKVKAKTILEAGS
jgi:catechol 2,3-dioxygenase-like lactoylglutathione lyase family enzyme